MRLQHTSPSPFGQPGNRFAAVQHKFPKAAVHNGLKDQNPNRMFATYLTDVSVADEAAIRSGAAFGRKVVESEERHRKPTMIHSRKKRCGYIRVATRSEGYRRTPP